MRLNKYLSRCGVASRRKSDELIKMATTTVNEEIILDPAFKFGINDDIMYDVSEVIVGLNSCVALKENGKVIVWGNDNDGGDPENSIGLDNKTQQIIDKTILNDINLGNPYIKGRNTIKRLDKLFKTSGPPPKTLDSQKLWLKLVIDIIKIKVF